MVIGVTNSVSDLELRGIASGPDNFNVFRVRRFEDLPSLMGDLLTTLCNGKFTTILTCSE